MKYARAICVGLLAATFTSGLSAAADLAPRYYPQPIARAPVYYPVYSWTGFYLGINGGGGWGSSQWDGVGGFNVSGGVIGGTIGYNWQIGRFLIGAEGDVDGPIFVAPPRHSACPVVRPAIIGSPPYAGGWDTHLIAFSLT
jgi:outer membrane immunogenic protein